MHKGSPPGKKFEIHMQCLKGAELGATTSVFPFNQRMVSIVLKLEMQHYLEAMKCVRLRLITWSPPREKQLPLRLRSSRPPFYHLTLAASMTRSCKDLGFTQTEL